MNRLRFRTLLSSSADMSRAPTIVSLVVGVLILLGAVAWLFGSQISTITDTRSGGAAWMLRPTPFLDPRHPVHYRLLDLWDYKSCPPPSCP